MFGKNEKLTDKVFMRIIAISFIGMFVCLAGLCSVTWAWFTDSTSSSANTITASSDFSLEAIAKDGEVTVCEVR
jgi:predicted ribosomally synthesized peptide with SipW-like signal peptide